MTSNDYGLLFLRFIGSYVVLKYFMYHDIL